MGVNIQLIAKLKRRKYARGGIGVRSFTKYIQPTTCIRTRITKKMQRVFITGEDLLRGPDVPVCCLDT